MTYIRRQTSQCPEGIPLRRPLEENVSSKPYLHSGHLANFYSQLLAPGSKIFASPKLPQDLFLGEPTLPNVCLLANKGDQHGQHGQHG